MSAYIILGILLVASSLLSGWMYISSNAHVSAKMILTVIFVLLSLLSWREITSLLGFPVKAYPHDGAPVIAFTVINEKTIDMWVWEGNAPRAYEFPLTDKLKSDIRTLGTGRMIFHMLGEDSGPRIKVKPSMPLKG